MKIHKVVLYLLLCLALPYPLIGSALPGNNDQGGLAWGEPYQLESLLLHWESSKELNYLQKFAERAQVILDQRDSVRGVTDWKGRSGPAWRSLHYSPHNEPFVWAVHTGLIVYPLLKFARLVRQDPTVPGIESFSDLAEQCAIAGQQALAFHDEDWVVGPTKTEGYYRVSPKAKFLPFPGFVFPLNFQSAMGRAYLELWLSSREPSALKRATALSRYVKNRIQILPIDKQSSRAFWNYMGEPINPLGEDISHASITADFARLCFESSITFGARDLRAIAATLPRFLAKDAFTVADYLGGFSQGGTHPALAAWSALGGFEPALVALSQNLFLRKTYRESDPSRMLSTAWMDYLGLYRTEATLEVDAAENVTVWSQTPGLVLVEYKSREMVDLLVPASAKPAPLLHLPVAKDWTPVYLVTVVAEGGAGVALKSTSSIAVRLATPRR